MTEQARAIASHSRFLPNHFKAIDSTSTSDKSSQNLVNATCCFLETSFSSKLEIVKVH